MWSLSRSDGYLEAGQILSEIVFLTAQLTFVLQTRTIGLKE